MIFLCSIDGEECFELVLQDEIKISIIGNASKITVVSQIVRLIQCKNYTKFAERDFESRVSRLEVSSLSKFPLCLL